MSGQEKYVSATAGRELADAVRWRQILKRDLKYRFQFRPDLSAYDSAQDKTALQWAAHYGQVDYMAAFVAEGADIHQKSSVDGWDAISIAAAKGYIEAVKWLIDNGAVLDSPSAQGDLAVHLAARNDHAEVVACLVNKDPALLQVINPKTGEDIYAAAKKAGHQDVLETINILAAAHGVFNSGNPTRKKITISRLQPRRKGP